MRSTTFDAACQPRFRTVCALFLICAGLGGCQDPLFPPNTPRTQFDAYDRMRGQSGPQQQTDVLGRPQPALRQRLSQK